MRLASAILVIGAASLLAQTPITFRYSYDDTGQLVKVVDSTGVVIEYVYDPVGNMLEIKRSTLPSPGALTIFSFNPQQAGTLSSVTIQGQGFSATPSANVVRFNGVVATVLSATPNTLVVQVPAGAGAGSITVTVGGVTATSASIFTPLAVPVITSITPNFIFLGSQPAAIQVVGMNLTGASFGFLPAFVPPIIATGVPLINGGGTAATIPISVLPIAQGVFTLVATIGQLSSETFPNSGNTVGVSDSQDRDSDGDGHPDGLEVYFGSNPFDAQSVPDLRAHGELLAPQVVVLNNIYPVSTPPVPQELLSAAVVVLNNTYPVSSPPTPQELLSAAVMILNSAGSFATPLRSTSPARGAADKPTGEATRPAGIALRFDGQDQQPGSLIEGQTIAIQADTGGGAIERVDFFVNDVLFGTDRSAPYSLVFTVPPVRELKFAFTVHEAMGAARAADPVTFAVFSDPGVTVTGRILEADGRPFANMDVQILIDGLQAEYFDFSNLTSAPDLTRVPPGLVKTVTALNVSNPGNMFSDPFGVGMAPDFAARFTGWLKVTTPGVHTFHLGADEGASLKIGGLTMVDIPQAKGNFTEVSRAVRLDPGLVPVEITFFENVGKAELQLSFTPPGGERQVITPDLLSRRHHRCGQ